MYTSSLLNFRIAGELLQAQLQQLGIALKLQGLDESTFGSIAYSNAPPSKRDSILTNRWWPDFNDPYDECNILLNSADAGATGHTREGILLSPITGRLIAAGAWANGLFGPLGIDLGLQPRLARVTLFRWAIDRPPGHPTHIDHIHDAWMRPACDNCTLVGAEDGVSGADPDHFSEAVTQEYVDLCRAYLVRRFPVMRHSTMRGNWAGILMQSPDARPIIDRLPQYEGLFCMAGDSGTSFKTSPAIGKCLAEWITEGKATTVDLMPFRSTRFAEGKPWVDAFDYGLRQATISR